MLFIFEGFLYKNTYKVFTNWNLCVLMAALDCRRDLRYTVYRRLDVTYFVVFWFFFASSSITSAAVSDRHTGSFLKGQRHQMLSDHLWDAAVPLRTGCEE